MSKKAKEKKRQERAKLKAAKKSANYLKYGPKAGHMGRRQKKKSGRTALEPRRGPKEGGLRRGRRPGLRSCRSVRCARGAI